MGMLTEQHDVWGLTEQHDVWACWTSWRSIQRRGHSKVYIFIFFILGLRAQNCWSSSHIARVHCFAISCVTLVNTGRCYCCDSIYVNIKTNMVQGAHTLHIDLWNDFGAVFSAAFKD